jgi:hypothetical protein
MARRLVEGEDIPFVANALSAEIDSTSIKLRYHPISFFILSRRVIEHGPLELTRGFAFWAKNANHSYACSFPKASFYLVSADETEIAFWEIPGQP